MRTTSLSRTVRALVAAASTTAIVALAGPAQAVVAPSAYVDGFGANHNKACRGDQVDIKGYGQPSNGYATVTEFNLFVVKTVDTNNSFTATIDWIGERGKVAYRVDVYNASGKHTFTKTLTVKWVACEKAVN
jgi:hypothetical protein